MRRIEDLAEALTTISEVSVLLDIDEDILREDMADRKSDVSRTYHRGMAKTALQLRRNELELASAGSPAAVQLTHEYLIKMLDDMRP